MQPKIKKFLLLNLLTLILGVGALFLSWPLLEKVLASFICSSLKNNNLLDCKIENLSLNPFTSLRLKNFKLEDKEHKVIELAELNLSYDLSSILKRKIVIETFLIHFRTLNLAVLPQVFPNSPTENKNKEDDQTKQIFYLDFTKILPELDILIPLFEFKIETLILDEHKEKQNYIKELSFRSSLIYSRSKKIAGKLSLSIDEINLEKQFKTKNLSASSALSIYFSDHQINIKDSSLAFQNLYRLNLHHLTFSESTSQVCLDTNMDQEINLDELKSLDFMDTQKISVSGKLKSNINTTASCIDKDFTSNFHSEKFKLNFTSENLNLGLAEYNLPEERMDLQTDLQVLNNFSNITLDHSLKWQKYFNHSITIKNDPSSKITLRQELDLQQIDRFFQAFRYQLTQGTSLNLLPNALPAKIHFESELNLSKDQLIEIQKNPSSATLWQSIPSQHRIHLLSDSISISKHQAKIEKLSLLAKLSLKPDILNIQLNSSLLKPSFKIKEQDQDATTIDTFKNTLNINLKDPYQLTSNLSEAEFKLTSETEILNLISPRTLKTSIPQILNSIRFSKKKNTNFITLNPSKISIPNLGINTEVQGNGKLAANNTFEFIQGDIKLQVDSKTIEEFQEEIKTAGLLELQGSVEWSLGNKMKSSGKLNLKDFGLSLKDTENSDILLSSANGNFHWQYSTETSPDKTQKNLKPNSENTLSQLISSYLSKQRDLESSYVSPRIKLDWQAYREKNKDYNPIRIQKIKYKEFDFENIVIDATFKEGLLNLYELSANFLTGTISTSSFLYFTDRPVSLVSEVHWTNINTSKLLDSLPKVKRKAKRFLIDSDPLLSGNINLDYNFVNQEISGAIEVTKLGKEQLRMLLYFIDPFEKDKSIRHIKNALYFGSIKNVSAPIRNGLFNLNVDLELLSLPVPTPKIQNFPISSLLSNFELAPNTMEPQTKDETMTPEPLKQEL